ncbi:uncharacterized protein LOC101461728 isoform X2 [Ceratitis capitata]|uniref:uncharacterized protein LOC101461728 isoform X2 n=1 Tax=Ceratitis capitata TaxID=7213 RepID=UPI00032A06D0|nr:uncharacterized protein LOC101461728 isoform X2 [Ceratitis capitata]
MKSNISIFLWSSSLSRSVVEKLSMGNDETKEFLIQEKEIVQRKMLEDMEKYLCAIEEIDRSNFTIPEYVLLATDYGHTKQYTEEDESEVDKKIASMKREFLENSVMIESIKVENSKYEEIRQHVDDEEKIIVQVQKVLDRMDTQWEKAKQLVEETQSMLH